MAENFGHRARRPGFKKINRLSVCRQHLCDFAAQVFITVAVCGQKSRALSGGQFKHYVQQLINLLPACRRHCASPICSS
ncbi:MAG: hypothetical protein IPO77_00645 [Acidobacteria bacterium]|nr:hypothetical protein [Acidobacteriota bacterium]